MSERDRIRNEYIRPAIHKWQYSDGDVHLADFIMDALDSWIEEQGEGSKYPDGRRVKMVNNAGTSAHLPHVNETGTVVDGHFDPMHEHLVLVEWDQDYNEFHDGHGDTKSSVRCKAHRGWWVPENTLEALE